MAGAEGADITAWIGCDVVGRDGPIGTVADVFLDEASGRPEWLAVGTGDGSDPVSFVPVSESTFGGEGLVVPFLAEEVHSAPRPLAGGALTREEEAALYRHYGMSGSAPDRAESSPTRADDAMTRSEEELHVAKTSSEAGRVRLRKWVETHHVTQTVPVAREEVRIEREPITAANVDQALTGAQISEAEYEVVLHEEQVTAAKVAVPKERVRLEKDVVVDEQQVAADLRKERIDVEHDGPRADPAV